MNVSGRKSGTMRQESRGQHAKKGLRGPEVTATSQSVSNRYITIVDAGANVNVLGVMNEVRSYGGRTWSQGTAV